LEQGLAMPSSEANHPREFHPTRIEQAGNFRLEELKLLRHEIEVRSEEQQSMERYILLADAAIYASLVFPGEHHPTEIAWIAWYLPGLLALAALTRWRESVRMIRRLARYIRELEAEFLGPWGGWETHLLRSRPNDVPIAPDLFVAFWLVLAVAPMILAGYQTSKDELTRWLAAGASSVATAVLVLGLIYWPSDGFRNDRQQTHDFV
jgi:hypothetical protein